MSGWGRFSVGTGRPVSTAVLYVGMFSVSWDRIANVDVGGFNVKLPTIMFAVALLTTMIDWAALRAELPGRHVKVVPLIGVMLLTYAFAGLLAAHPIPAMLQLVTVILGAIVPFLAVYLNIRLFSNVDGVLTAFIWGGYVAAAFGLYQLAASYTGLPQIIEYEALGGGVPRISSFSYEAGYFGYFLILVIAAYVARARLRDEPARLWVLATLIGTTLLLVNSRAAFVTVPLLMLLLWWRRPKRKGIVAPLVAVSAWSLAMAALLAPGMFVFLWERAATILDPTEETSNAPRLEALGVAWQVFAEHPVLGIGGGNLLAYTQALGHDTTGLESNSAITNNAYLQAALDGGVVLLLLQVTFLIVIAVKTYRRKDPVARALASGWITVVIVAFLGTSYYWNMQLWVIAGAALAVVSMRNSMNAPQTSATQLWAQRV